MTGPFDEVETSVWQLTPTAVAAFLATADPAQVAAVTGADGIVYTASTVGSEPARFLVVTTPLPPGTRWLRLDSL